MPASKGFIMLPLLLTWCLLHIDVEATWDVSIVGSSISTISDAQINSILPPTILISNPAVTFSPSYSSSTAAFPGNCQTTSTNPYGWSLWNQSVAVLQAQATIIRLVFQQTPGFAILNSETIECTPIDPVSGVQYYFLASSQPLSPTFYSFTITSSTSPVPVAWGGSSAFGASEYDIRAFGFELILILQSADVWLESETQTVLDHISSYCGDETNVLQTLLGITTANMEVVSSSPNQLRISVSTAALYAMPNVFDISSTMSITYTPVAGVTLKGGVQIQGSTSLTVTITALTVKPDVQLLQYIDGNYYPSLSGVVNFTEDCIRGAVPCELSFGLSIFSGGTFLSPQNVFFEDSFSAAPYSEAALNGFTQDLFSYALGTDSTMTIFLNQLPSLDISNTSDFYYVVSWRMFTDLQPPTRGTQPFIIRITPSPTRIQGTAVNITQTSIWEGGHVINITMGGDSWVESAVLEMFTDASYATYTDGNSNPDGWQTSKYVILGVDAFQFISPTWLQLHFIQDVNDILISSHEYVTLVVNGSMLSSGLDPASVEGLSFTITAEPPTLVVNGANTFEESQVWSGDVNFTLTLAGDKWIIDNFITACWIPMISSWTSIEPSTADRGWNVQSIRDQLMSNAVSLPPDGRNLYIHWNKSTDFYTEQGETIVMSAPQSCLYSGKQVTPQGNPTLTILPHPAVVSNYFVETSSVYATQSNPMTLNASAMQLPIEAIPTFSDENPTVQLPVLAESRLRLGNISFVLDFTFDRLDTTITASISDFGRALTSVISGDGASATGWNIEKDNIIDAANVQIRAGGQQLVIPFLFCPFYAISQPELVTMQLPGAWMLSRFPPLNNGAFYVQVSAGLVSLNGPLVPASGLYSESVTEADIRNGALSFDLWLLGDSWSTDHAAFADSFFSAATAPERSYMVEPSASISQASLAAARNPNDVGINQIKGSLLSGTNMWNYSVSNGYSKLVMTTQPVPSFDISSNETIVIDLQNQTVASQIAPSWLLLDGSTVVAYEFVVIPVAGELLVSGQINGASEQSMRVGGLSLQLSLLGELFTPNASAMVAAGLFGDLSSPTAFNALKADLVTPESVSCNLQSCTITLAGSLLYSIDSIEIVSLTLPQSAFASGIVPVPAIVCSAMPYTETESNLTIPLLTVQQSGGTLTALISGSSGLPSFTAITSAGINESYFSGNAVPIRLALHGDTWNVDLITERPGDFVGGFQSATGIASEPHGFNRYRYQILQLAEPANAIQIVNVTNIDIMFCLSCAANSLNILSSDSLYFVMPSAEFTSSGVMPVPAQLPLPLLASTQWITVTLSNDAILTSFWSGQLTEDRFVLEIADFMNADPSQVFVQSFLQNQLIFTFVTSNDPAVVLRDSRTGSQMTQIFLSLNTTFLMEMLGASQIYLEAAGQLETFTPLGPTPEGQPVSSTSASLNSQLTGGVWFAIVVAVVATVGALIAVTHLWKKRDAPVGSFGSTSVKS